MIPPVEALNTQLEAVSLIQRMLSVATKKTDRQGTVFRSVGERWKKRQSAWYDLDWTNDMLCLSKADPFLWASDPTQACLQAAQSLPLETALNRENLPYTAVWWHFEDPLPIPTTDSESKIRALAMGWFTAQDGSKYFRLSVWNDERVLPPYSIAPSQIWTWMEGETLGEMLQRVEGSHDVLYGPDGKYANVKKVAEEIFLNATGQISRFVLAAMAWLEQKVVTDDIFHVERHRRKDFERTLQRPPTLRVVHLRKREKSEVIPSDIPGEPHKVEWTHQWTVDGHWRNQPYGPGRTEHKLTWIFPFVKGPSDKPFKPRTPKVYEVSR